MPLIARLTTRRQLLLVHHMLRVRDTVNFSNVKCMFF